MNINDLTIGQAKELAAMFSGNAAPVNAPSTIDTFALGKTVIIRTYSAGVFCGTLAKKSGEEVILENARRLWQWKAKEGISLSSVAVQGIDESGSRIAEPVPHIWLNAIEIIPVSEVAEKSIMGAKNAKAQ